MLVCARYHHHLLVFDVLTTTPNGRFETCQHDEDEPH